MMTADYESAYDTIQITLEDVERFTGGSDVVEDGAVIVRWASHGPRKEGHCIAVILTPAPH